MRIFDKEKILSKPPLNVIRAVWRKIKTIVRKIVQRSKNALMDTDITIAGHAKGNGELFLQTIRYKSAGMGIPLTKNEKTLKSLYNIHKGQRAFIMGNGPSLNKCDLTLLKNEVSFGVNNIYLNYEKMGFCPTYYVVEDFLLAEDRADQINLFHGPKYKFFGNYLDYCIQESQDVVWTNTRLTYYDYEGFPNFSQNATRMIWVGGTVSYVCLQLAYYMGFSKVYLIGFDHSYRIPEDAEVNDERITSVGEDPNHFDSSYFGKGYRWHDPNVNRMETAYRKAKKIYELHNRQIFNATVGGMLEVFPRVEYQELFK